MATLTTLDGQQIVFNPGSVSVVSDHDLASISNETVTCVYGITTGTIKIAQSVSAFIAAIGLSSKFLAVTPANGKQIYIEAPSVKSLVPPVPGGYPPSVRTVIGLGGMNIGVTEDMAALKSAINAHGGNL